MIARLLWMCLFFSSALSSASTSCSVVHDTTHSRAIITICQSTSGVTPSPCRRVMKSSNVPNNIGFNSSMGGCCMVVRSPSRLFSLHLFVAPGHDTRIPVRGSTLRPLKLSIPRLGCIRPLSHVSLRNSTDSRRSSARGFGEWNACYRARWNSIYSSSVRDLHRHGMREFLRTSACDGLVYHGAYSQLARAGVHSAAADRRATYNVGLLMIS